LVKEAITFSNSGRFINPSRANPALIKMQKQETRNNYAIQANASFNNHFTLFTSVVYVQHSNLHDDDTASPFHQIQVNFAKLEFERFCSFFCMVFKEKALHIQTYKGCITISTRARVKEEDTCMWQIF
jgi:hypothetical protein